MKSVDINLISFATLQHCRLAHARQPFHFYATLRRKLDSAVFRTILDIDAAMDR